MHCHPLFVRNMNSLLPGLLGVVLSFGSVLVSGVVAQSSPDQETLLQLPTTDWLTNGGDLFNRNFSALTEINTDNVDQLGPIWRTHLDGSGIGRKYSGEAQPIVHDLSLIHISEPTRPY